MDDDQPKSGGCLVFQIFMEHNDTPQSDWVEIFSTYNERIEMEAQGYPL